MTANADRFLGASIHTPWADDSRPDELARATFAGQVVRAVVLVTATHCRL